MDEYMAHLALMRRKATDTLWGCYVMAGGGFLIAVTGLFLHPFFLLLGVVLMVTGFVRVGREKRRIDELTAQALQHKAVS